jgi:uncharacterized glyoxalase superfamily protein PhnB
MTTTAPRRPAFIPSVIYKDNRAALKWLQNAFGFEASEVLTAANGDIVHAEMSHGARARQAGAKIAMEPADQFYGDRTYMAVDLEGHYWTFAQPVRYASKEEMEKETGFKHETLT